MGWPHGRARDGGIDEVPLPPTAAGRLWLCGKHVVGPDPDAALARSGASVVVCLNELGELSSRYPPHERLVRRAHAEGIRFSLGSDGHTAEQVGVLDAPLALARAVGVDEQALFDPWRDARSR